MTPRLRLLVQIALGLAVVFAGDFVWRSMSDQTAGPVQPAPAKAAPSAQKSQEVQATAWRKPRPLDAFRAVFEAPLFTPGRNAPAPPTQVVEQAAPPPPDPLDSAALVGVAADGSSKIALIQSGGSLLRLETGDAIGDWTVTAIDRAKVVFGKDGQTRELALPH